MITYLKESYDKNCPEWAKNLISRQNVTHKGRRIWGIENSLRVTSIDLSRVTFHNDFDKSYLKDPTKICFFKIECIHLAYYRDETETAYLVKGGDGTVYYDGEVYRKDYDWGKQKLSKKSQKWLLEHMVDFCWIDMYETDSDELRRQRASASSQGGDWKRGKGQFPKEIQDWTTDEFGDRIYNNHIEWRVPSGQDKSGYPINPDKYTKKLYTIGQDNYAERLEDMYKKTLEVRKLYDDLKIVSPNELKSPQKRSAWRRFSNPIHELRWIVDNIIATYNGMVEEIGEEIDNASDNGEDWSRNPNANYFYKLYRDFKHKYAELIKRMNEENNAE